MNNDEKQTSLRKNALLVFLTLVFSVGCIMYVRVDFPGVSWLETIVGSITFGVFAMLCSTSLQFCE
jgi:hypothetical protein